jgi:hypothetical protein
MLERPGVIPVTFVGGVVGAWRVDQVRAVVGESLPVVERVDMRAGREEDAAAVWTLRGVAGHARYVVRDEKTALDERSPPLGRPEATRAALIPIRKSAAWWSRRRARVWHSRLRRDAGARR